MSKYLRIVCICVICLFVVEKAEILYPPVWSSNTDNSFNWQSFAMSSSGLWHPGYPDQKDEHRVVDKIFWNGNHNRTGSIVCHKIATKSTSINARSEGRQPIVETTLSTLLSEQKSVLPSLLKQKWNCLQCTMQINEKLFVSPLWMILKSTNISKISLTTLDELYLGASGSVLLGVQHLPSWLFNILALFTVTALRFEHFTHVSFLELDDHVHYNDWPWPYRSYIFTIRKILIDLKMNTF